MHISIESLSHQYTGKQDRQALVNISLEIPSGQFVAVVGPSGCGKSTLLRLLANLLQTSKGNIWLDGLSPAEAIKKRSIAWIAQNPALLPWINVKANVEMALRFQPANVRPHISPEEALTWVGLNDVLDAYPHTLSGGMQQRLALARVLVMDSGLWLMDEPFASLDEITREYLTEELLAIWEQLRPTVLWVTHNIHEALRMADRVLVLSAHPGEIAADINVVLPRPRLETSPEYLNILASLRSTLQGSIHTQVAT